MSRKIRPLPILTGFLLAAAGAAETVVGIAGATAPARVTVAIPAIYGLRILPGDSSGGAAAREYLRLSVFSTAGGGSVALRRLVLPASPDAGRQESNRKSSNVFFLTTSSPLGSREVTERLDPPSSGRASDLRPPATVIYELWQF